MQITHWSAYSSSLESAASASRSTSGSADRSVSRCSGASFGKGIDTRETTADQPSGPGLPDSIHADRGCVLSHPRLPCNLTPPVVEEVQAIYFLRLMHLHLLCGHLGLISMSGIGADLPPRLHSAADDSVVDPLFRNLDSFVRRGPAVQVRKPVNFRPPSPFTGVVLVSRIVFRLWQALHSD